MKYPIEATCIAHGTTEAWSGATLVADDGTFPMRAILRILAPISDRMWRKGHDDKDCKKAHNLQAAYIGTRLHITHVMFLPMPPQIVHSQNMHVWALEYRLTLAAARTLLQHPKFLSYGQDNLSVLSTSIAKQQEDGGDDGTTDYEHPIVLRFMVQDDSLPTKSVLELGEQRLIEPGICAAADPYLKSR